MAYSDFDLEKVVDTFGLEVDRDSDLFAGVSPVAPSDYLRNWLDEFARVGLAMSTETSRREYIIGPVLLEAKRRAKGPVNVFPGYTLDADRSRGLCGFCDYIITRNPEFYFIRRPVIAVVEAKKDDFSAGLGQCAATVVGVRVFNEREGAPIPTIYGCVTNGSIWRFLRLVDTRLSIDRREYYLENVGTILGILLQIMEGAAGGSAGVAA